MKWERKRDRESGDIGKEREEKDKQGEYSYDTGKKNKDTNDEDVFCFLFLSFIIYIGIFLHEQEKIISNLCLVNFVFRNKHTSRI
jgi:hypothetical protein